MVAVDLPVPRLGRGQAVADPAPVSPGPAPPATGPEPALAAVGPDSAAGGSGPAPAAVSRGPAPAALGPGPGQAAGGPGPAPAATGARPEPQAGLGGGRGISLWVFDAGLACCAVEVSAALRRFAELLPPQAPAPVHVLVVAGTVTDKLAPLVRDAYRDLPEPRRVLSFGACSNSGGPYWDSYSVTKGADQIIPVDVYVPGCPPRPEALLHGLRLLLEAREAAP